MLSEQKKKIDLTGVFKSPVIKSQGSPALWSKGRKARLNSVALKAIFATTGYYGYTVFRRRYQLTLCFVGLLLEI